MPRIETVRLFIGAVAFNVKDDGRYCFPRWGITPRHAKERCLAAMDRER